LRVCSTLGEARVVAKAVSRDSANYNGASLFVVLLNDRERRVATTDLDQSTSFCWYT
jgi:hypothetical protein